MMSRYAECTWAVTTKLSNTVFRKILSGNSCLIQRKKIVKTQADLNKHTSNVRNQRDLDLYDLTQKI